MEKLNENGLFSSYEEAEAFLKRREELEQATTEYIFENFRKISKHIISFCVLLSKSKNGGSIYETNFISIDKYVFSDDSFRL